MATEKGRVVTFYSYKGGTGRTMAAANVACILSRRAGIRRDILLIDWDLEAPGLHWFFPVNSASREEERFSLRHDGLLEVLEHLSSEVSDSPELLMTDETAEDLIRSINFDRFIVETNVPKVHLMPAGRFDDGYAERVNRLNLRTLFATAPSLFRILAESLSEKYECVLIDSRTGLNDTSGICTALLPDQLVVVFTPNRQSVSGGVEIAKQAVRYRRDSADIRPLTVFPLPSRVDVSEPDLLERWRFGDLTNRQNLSGYQQRFEQLFVNAYDLDECDLKNYFDEVQVQHVPRYSYGEEIAALHERGTRLSLSRSYASFTNMLLNGEPPWSIPSSTSSGAALVSGATASEAKIQAAKEYIAEERFRLKLFDLVATEVRTATSETLRYSGSPGDPTAGAFAQRLRAYESSLYDLIPLQALLGFWADSVNRRLIALGPKQICEQLSSGSGLMLYLAARWYPALLLLYAGGIASVAGQRYDNLRELMTVPVRNLEDDQTKPTLIDSVTRAVRELERSDAFKLVPGFERRYTPRSDYLLGFFRPILDDLLALGGTYEYAFDTFEFLYACEYANRHERQSQPESKFWGPIGRFGWKKHIIDEVIAEADTQSTDWGPVQAGLFNGSIDRFREIAKGMRELVNHLPWF